MSDWRGLVGPLAASSLGEGERVVFCHGFTQTSASWKPIAAQVAGLGYEAVVVDLPGHGGSSGVRADLRLTADMLTTMFGRASYVGYSLGGRLCLQAALAVPGGGPPSGGDRGQPGDRRRRRARAAHRRRRRPRPPRCCATACRRSSSGG